MRRLPSSARVYAALALVQLFFGLHYVAAKLLLAECPPALWALVRVTGAAFVLSAAAGIAGRVWPRAPSVWARLALYAVFGVVINQLCFVEGLARTTPAHSSILMTFVPVTTLFFAVLGRQERLTPRKLLSFALGAAGVLFVLRPAAAELAGASLAGDLLTLVNGLSYALFLVMSKRLLKEIDPLVASAVVMSFGVLGLLPFGLAALPSFEPGLVSARGVALGAFIIVGPTALAYLLSYWALARVESSLVALFIYVQPVIAAALSVAVLGETLAPHMFLGAGLILLAGYLALGRASGSSAMRARSSAPSGNADSSMSNSGE